MRRLTILLLSLLTGLSVAFVGAPAPAAPTSYVLAGTWQTSGSSVVKPDAVAAGGDGFVYVADSGSGCPCTLTKYDTAGNRVAAWPLPTQAQSMVVDSQHQVHVALYADVLTFPGQVLVFDGNGQAVRSYGALGDNDGRLFDVYFPYDVAVDASGHAFTVDSRGKVNRFAPDGSLLATWGTEGNAPGQLKDPVSLDLGADGTVYVADTRNDRIQQFTADGALIRGWGQAGTTSLPAHVRVAPDGDVHVLAGGTIGEWSPEGSPLGTLSAPELYAAGVFGFAPDGSLYVASRLSAMVPGVYRFTPAAPAPPAPGAPVVVSKKLTVKKSRVKVVVACPTGASCTGRLTIRRKRTVLAKAPYTVAGGAKRGIRARLTRPGRRLVKRHPRVRVVVTLSSAGKTVATKRLRLRR